MAEPNPKILMIECYFQLPEGFEGSFADGLRLLADCIEERGISFYDDEPDSERREKEETSKNLSVDQHRRQLMKIMEVDGQVGMCAVVAEWNEKIKDWIQIPL